jgi:UDP:flavonoid glycosyltransferase YjiC (YdhE family)
MSVGDSCGVGVGSIPSAQARPRVLLAWEHGRNFGHAARLLEIAAALSLRGADVVWAVPARELQAPWLVDAVGSKNAAPSSACGVDANSPSIRSFADILAAIGFASEGMLKAAVSQWLTLFDRLAVDRIVLDYAPTAQLAALIARLPAAQIASGFEAPPADCPVFGIGMRGPMLDRQNASRLQAMDQVVVSVATQLGRAGLAGLRDVFAYPSRWYDCIAETDPYGPRADGAYIGPVGRFSRAEAAQWPPGPEQARKVFVYLRSEIQLVAMLSALPAPLCRVLCVWPGASEHAAGKLRRDGLNLLTRPIDLAAILPGCDLVVSYGSVATVCMALLLGKPQLMWPTEVDKHLVAARVAAIGAGRMLGSRTSLPQLRAAIADLLDTEDCGRIARSVAARYDADFEGVAQLCDALLTAPAAAKRAMPGMAACSVDDETVRDGANALCKVH